MSEKTLRDMPSGKDIFSRTKRIVFWLSNFCNLERAHVPCPVWKMTDKAFLPEKVVLDVLRTAAKHGFKGMVSFHMYNEPLIDPRLAWFLENTKEILPNCTIVSFTNGTMLTRSLLNELIAHGLDKLYITTYSKEVERRLQKENIEDVSIPVAVKRGHLDKRIELYDRKMLVRKKPNPCYSPLCELIITPHAKVGLCCYDWAQQHTFGDLTKNTLEEILQGEEIWEVYNDLSAGNRNLSLCSRCNYSRGVEDETL
jgi:hypothetical protein